MATETLRFTVVETEWGPGGLVAGRSGLRESYLPGWAEEALIETIRRRHPEAERSERGLLGAMRGFARYFVTGRIARPGPRLDLSGVGEFTASIYEELRKVPPGETVTYAELAQRIGRPGACRAAGKAVASNPLPLFIPCHRVVRSGGGLAGYRPEGGVALKRAMLDLEA